MCKVWVSLSLLLVYLESICAYAYSLEQLLAFNGPLDKSDETKVVSTLHSVGGETHFKAELETLITTASSLRNGTSCSITEFHLGTSIVAKLCFSDNICWAAKLQEPWLVQGMQRANLAATTVTRFCPNIPVPKPVGFKLGERLYYSFTEWVEGKTLSQVVGESLGDRVIGQSLFLPEKVVAQLSEFVYNLTFCPIPEQISIPHPTT
jgi:hypothetical protein